jgi:hypothetical protein
MKMSSIKRTHSHDNVPTTHKGTDKAAPVDSGHSNRMSLISSVNARETRQQARIDQGVQSGELTKNEAAKLEKQQKKIDAKVEKERAAHGGHLTNAERKEINQEQNKASTAIYSQKHDDQVTNGAQKLGVDSRYERQGNRIEDGILSGQLTGKEVAKLTKIEAKIEAKESLGDISGGKLTEKERLSIEHLQDRASKLISEAKHNKTAEPTTTSPVTTAPVDYQSLLTSLGLATGAGDTEV